MLSPVPGLVLSSHLSGHSLCPFSADGPASYSPQACKEVQIPLWLPGHSCCSISSFKWPPGRSSFVLCAIEPCQHLAHVLTLHTVPDGAASSRGAQAGAASCQRCNEAQAAHITGMSKSLTHCCVQSVLWLRTCNLLKSMHPLASVCFIQKPLSDLKYVKVVYIQVLSQ